MSLLRLAAERLLTHRCATCSQLRAYISVYLRHPPIQFTGFTNRSHNRSQIDPQRRVISRLSSGPDLVLFVKRDPRNGAL